MVEEQTFVTQETFSFRDAIINPTHTFDAGVKGKKAAGKKLWENRDKLPGLKATVRYQNMTTDGAARFGVVYTIHYTDRW